MKKFFENKFAFVVVSFLFASALTWNLTHGGETVPSGHLLSKPAQTLLTHGPSMPPDPWDLRIAHGPSMPPDPWDLRIAHGPSMPPDPWDLCIAHGPSMPPDPWDIRRRA
jgi:hypothetical protein